MRLLTPEHDPGGAKAMPMLKGCRGDATFFGPTKAYRPLLTRSWTKHPKRRWLWVGMNPSTANAISDDLTIRKEIEFTIQGGGDDYAKCNIMDYRATHPQDLLKLGADVRSSENMYILREQAALADRIIAAWGRLDPKFEYYAAETLITLRASGKKIFCLGRTANGSPRHPSRLAYSEKLEKYDA
jgi:hypothetical protein